MKDDFMVSRSEKILYETLATGLVIDFMHYCMIGERVSNSGDIGYVFHNMTQTVPALTLTGKKLLEYLLEPAKWTHDLQRQAKTYKSGFDLNGRTGKH
jgi:hypothetical protein